VRRPPPNLSHTRTPGSLATIGRKALCDFGWFMGRTGLVVLGRGISASWWARNRVSVMFDCSGLPLLMRAD
jgi:hypothetical protein